MSNELSVQCGPAYPIRTSQSKFRPSSVRDGRPILDVWPPTRRLADWFASTALIALSAAFRSAPVRVDSSPRVNQILHGCRPRTRQIDGLRVFRPREPAKSSGQPLFR